jgi:5'-nucleotidase
VSWAEIKGVAIARQGVRRYCDIFQKRVDPRGKTYYWLAGELVEEVEEPTPGVSDQEIPTDVQAIRTHYITITPLQFNLTNSSQFQAMSALKFNISDNA